MGQTVLRFRKVTLANLKVGKHSVLPKQFQNFNGYFVMKIDLQSGWFEAKILSLKIIIKKPRQVGFFAPLCETGLK